MFEKLDGWEQIGLIVILMGSVVDIFQFTWIVKRWFSSAKKSLEDRIRKQILLEQFEKRDHIDSDEFPGGLDARKKEP